MRGKGLVTGCVFCLVFAMTAFANEGGVSDSQDPGVVGVDLSVRKMRPEAVSYTQLPLPPTPYG